MKKIMMVHAPRKSGRNAPRQISLRAAGRDSLLRAHHDRVGEPAEQHEQRQHDVHDADALMINQTDPLAPEIRHISL